MTQHWTPSGGTWTWTTFVGDTQVIYRVEAHKSLLHGDPEFFIRRKVAGASTPDQLVVGIQRTVDKAKRLAEFDAQELERKGF